MGGGGRSQPMTTPLDRSLERTEGSLLDFRDYRRDQFMRILVGQSNIWV